ncbi:MAG: SH3 domain-containing protein [Nitrospirota bacterium]
MNHRHTFLAVMVFMVTAMTDAAFGETLYVSAKSAQLRSGKTSLDPVVANLKIGEALEVVKRDDRWVQVKTAKGVTGWIYSGNVSESKPTGGDNELAALGKGFRRTEASGVTASAGARGLDKASESYANRVGITQQHRDAVDRMTANKIAEDDIQAFLKAGRLGEYAE